LVSACPIKVNVEICQSTLETSYVSHTMKNGSNHAEFFPADFMNYITTELSNKMSADYEQLVWQGNTSLTASAYPNQLCDGLKKQFLADGDVVDVSATASITVANVIGELNNIYNAVPAAIKFSPDLVFYVSTAFLGAYKQAVAAASAEVYYVKDAVPEFLGIPLILAQGLAANNAVAAETTNLFLISDLLSDFEQVRFLPMLDRTGDDTIRIVGRMKFAVSYAYGAEVVLYS